MLDACVRHVEGATARFANTTEGIAELTAFCRRHKVGLVVMEATGRHERLAFGLLWAQRIKAAIVNPRAVRQFAHAMGQLEKTDRLDAGLIAWYAEARHIKPTPPPSKAQRQLAALVTRMRQLTQLRVDQTNQRRTTTDAAALDGFKPLLDLINLQLRGLEAQVIRLIADDPLWARLDAAFRTIKGVANRTVARLIADLPEIGTLSNKAIAKLTGLAPIANDSGKASKRRHIRGGRATVRSILVVVAEIVRRHEPDFRAYHASLIAAGKPKLVARVALAHKLLTRLNAKARDARALTA
jgi:transposase